MFRFKWLLLSIALLSPSLGFAQTEAMRVAFNLGPARPGVADFGGPLRDQLIGGLVLPVSDPADADFLLSGVTQAAVGGGGLSYDLTLHSQAMREDVVHLDARTGGGKPTVALLTESLGKQLRSAMADYMRGLESRRRPVTLFAENVSYPEAQAIVSWLNRQGGQDVIANAEVRIFKSPVAELIAQARASKRPHAIANAIDGMNIGDAGVLVVSRVEPDGVWIRLQPPSGSTP